MTGHKTFYLFAEQVTTHMQFQHTLCAHNALHVSYGLVLTNANHNICQRERDSGLYHSLIYRDYHAAIDCESHAPSMF